MSEEVGLEREDERHAQRAEELADEQAETAAEQVGVGTAPGRPPASGTGPRSTHTEAPPTGRRDDVRATRRADQPAVEESKHSTEP